MMKVLKPKFPQLSLAKVEKGVSVGPQIRKLFKYYQIQDVHQRIVEPSMVNAMSSCIRILLISGKCRKEKDTQQCQEITVKQPKETLQGYNTNGRPRESS
ncbi:hypothetical protein NPIL_132471 [Nephila pilipes]|uniref:Uncharacterized protein n=1 Tax=Nephila pilipes TaxID=299642 RepID=A0A8X6N184_NEPPI|nr:hypothetical protein NPIL_132471 [Nephila pilipes]